MDSILIQIEISVGNNYLLNLASVQLLGQTAGVAREPDFNRDDFNPGFSIPSRVVKIFK